MVSVIIPTFGGGDGIERVIDSITKQTYRDIEIIVVDDNGAGSDNQLATENTIRGYFSNNNFTYIKLEKNLGGSGARNAGARISKGAYLMFLDDDDTVAQDKIECQVKALENSTDEYGIAYCSTKVFEGDKLSNVVEAHRSGDILLDYLIGKIYIGTGTALLKKCVWEKLGGYDESFVRHQDWEFFSRVLNAYKAIATPTTYFYRYITNRNAPKDINRLEVFADHYIDFLMKYPFRLSKKQIKKVVNRNNSRVALMCIKQKDMPRFFKVMKKYDSFICSYAAFVKFSCCVVLDKVRGIKT